jgi:maltose alpha-D-glucosyltransferase/alpha-amylase
MRYLNLPTKEGGYFRTGARTPMQWKAGKNLGFSGSDTPYLPVDDASDAPTVEAQEKDPASLLNTVKALLRLRHKEADLGARPNLEIIHAEKGGLPFVYRRGSLLLALNPSGHKAAVPVKFGPVKTAVESLYAIGKAGLENGVCSLEAQSFGVWRV